MATDDEGIVNWADVDLGDADLSDAEQRAALFHSIIESMGESVLVVDRNGKEVYGNKVLRRFRGQAPNDANRDRWRTPGQMKIYDADGNELPPDQWPVARALRGDYDSNFEIRVTGMAHREGETTLAISTRSLLSASGVVDGAVIVTRDITDFRITEEKLRQSQKLETIGQLTGGIAHDFNNVLAAITSSVEVLKRGVAGDAKLDRVANIIETAAFRGADLTRALLAFARRQTLQATNVEIDKIVRETARLLRPALDATITLKIEHAPGLNALVDHGQLAAALLNLCVNARDAMPKGGVLTIAASPVTLEERETVKAGDYVRIIVSDTGAGMSAETLARAVEPFFTTKSVGEGSGLGLSMVFGFARQSGGDLRITSAEDVGTTIELFLPLVAAPGQVGAAQDADGPVGRLRVLVVDDDPLVRDALGLQLRDTGFETFVAEDGVQALEMVQNGLAFDVLLTDMVMPRMSGEELAIAVSVHAPRARIILSTGYTDKTVTPPEGLHWTILRKPYSAQDLLIALRTSISHGA